MLQSSTNDEFPFLDWWIDGMVDEFEEIK